MGFNTYMQSIFKASLFVVCIMQTSFSNTDSLLALLTLDDAVKKINQQGNNKVLATKTESEKGKSVHIIKVLTPAGRIQHIKVDAESGKIIK